VDVRKESTGRRIFVDWCPFAWLLSLALAIVATCGQDETLLYGALTLAGLLTLVAAVWAGLVLRGGRKLGTGCLFFGWLGAFGLGTGAYEMGGGRLPEAGSRAGLILAGVFWVGLVWLATVQKVANARGGEEGARPAGKEGQREGGE
jgi:hypothetical protein